MGFLFFNAFVKKFSQKEGNTAFKYITAYLAQVDDRVEGFDIVNRGPGVVVNFRF